VAFYGCVLAASVLLYCSSLTKIFSFFFFVYHELPVPSWKDVWSNCSPVYRPSGSDSIRFGRLYLLKQLGGVYYLSDSCETVLQYAELFFLGFFIYKFCEYNWINLTLLEKWCRKLYASGTKMLSLLSKGNCIWINSRLIKCFNAK